MCISYQNQQRVLFDLVEDQFRRGIKPTSIVKPVENYALDNRFYLTSVSFLLEPLQETILKEIIELLKEADPNQYYYLKKSLHITIFNVYMPNHIDLVTVDKLNKIRAIFKKVLSKHPPIEFELRGLFELPSSIGIRCYCNENLRNVIQDLEKELAKINIKNEKRLASEEIFFGNVTIARFVTKPNAAFKKVVKKLKHTSFGTFTAESVSLIKSNAVVHPNMTVTYDTYQFKSAQ